MSNGTNAVLYAWGLFQEKYSAGLSNQQQVQEVTGSGFTTVIVWTLHVRPNGDLVYNDPLPDGKGIVNGGVFNPAYGYMVDLVRALKRPGSSVTRVLFGMGSGQSEDFTNIFNLIQQGRLSVLQQSFQALANALAIDGFDLDNEDQLPGFPPPPAVPTPEQLAVAERMATFTLMLKNIRPTVTYGVYSDEYFWFECLRRVYVGNVNRQAVAWLNLQWYSGGEDNNPLAWVGDLTTYQSTHPLGIPSPAAFVVIGFWVRNPTDLVHCGPGYATDGDCPLAVRRYLQLLKLNNPGMTGAFIWNSFDVFRCMQNGVCLGQTAMAHYARAVKQGLM